jgi:hypothetical protein
VEKVCSDRVFLGKKDLIPCGTKEHYTIKNNSNYYKKYNKKKKMNSIGDGCEDCEAGMYSDSSADFICGSFAEGSYSPRGASKGEECEENYGMPC